MRHIYLLLKAACYLIVFSLCLSSSPDDPHYKEQYRQIRQAALTARIDVMDMTSASIQHRDAVLQVLSSLKVGQVHIHSSGTTCTSQFDVKTNTTTICTNKTKPEIHITIGNSILPSTSPVGRRVNIHICTSTADMNIRPHTATEMSLTFDYLIVPTKEQAELTIRCLRESLLVAPNENVPVVRFEGIHPSRDTFMDKLEALVIDGIMVSDVRQFIRENINKMRGAKLSIAKQNFYPPMSNLVYSNISYEQFRKVAVIIEPRITGSLEYVIRNVAYHLPGWGIQIHCSYERHGNEQYLKKILSDIASDIVFVPVPIPVTEAWEYSKLIKSYQFWELLSFSADKVLIFQIDTLLLRTRDVSISEYMTYDYVGAPWHINFHQGDSNHWLKRMQRFGYLKKGIGNGGLSLRDVNAMKKITERFGCDIVTYDLVSQFIRNGSYVSIRGIVTEASNHRKTDTNNEDSFFVINAEKMGMSIPSRKDAYRFAQEGICEDTGFAGIPLGIHAAWNYHPRARMQELLHLSLPE